MEGDIWSEVGRAFDNVLQRQGKRRRLAMLQKAVKREEAERVTTTQVPAVSRPLEEVLA